MITKEEFPPNYEDIKKAFPIVEVEKKAVFAYGDTIYNPFKGNVTPDIEAHESVHSLQQGKDPVSWWKRYILDPVFRLHQEVPAYGAQYKFIKEMYPRKLSDWFKQQFAFTLSGPLYGNMIAYQEADSLLRRFTKNE